MQTFFDLLQIQYIYDTYSTKLRRIFTPVTYCKCAERQRERIPTEQTTYWQLHRQISWEISCIRKHIQHAISNKRRFLFVQHLANLKIRLHLLSQGKVYNALTAMLLCLQITLIFAHTCCCYDCSTGSHTSPLQSMFILNTLVFRSISFHVPTKWFLCQHGVLLFPCTHSPSLFIEMRCFHVVNIFVSHFLPPSVSFSLNPSVQC